MAKRQAKANAQTPIRLDFGCGTHKREGYLGIDCVKFPGVDKVLDLATKPLPWADNEVESIHMSHFIEHLKPEERCWVLNEAYRVLRPGGQVTVMSPHWSTNRAYGDPTHQWPPIGEFWFMYLNKKWRLQEAPHADAKYLSWGYACDFEATWGYALNPSLVSRADDQKQWAATHYKEAVWELQATLTARK